MTEFPPGKDSGVFVLHPETGKVLMSGNKFFELSSQTLKDLSEISNITTDNTDKVSYIIQEVGTGRRRLSTSVISDDPPDDMEYHDAVEGFTFDHIMHEDALRTVKSWTSSKDKDIRYQVAHLTRQYGWCTKEELKEYSRNNEKFPVNEKQIQKHYVHFPATTQGKMTRSTFTNKPTLRTKPMGIGSFVSTDFVPFKEGGNTVAGVQLFVDKFISHVHAIFTPTSGTSKVLGDCVAKTTKFYAKHGHKLEVIQTDSLKAYSAPVYEKVLDGLEITRQASAPHEQQQNPVERIVRSMEEGVSSMRAAAPWVPSKLITFCVILWVCLWNLGSGTTSGISRVEQVTHVRPSATHTGLPGTYGDLFAVHQPRNGAGHFTQPHGRLVTYLCPHPN